VAAARHGAPARAGSDFPRSHRRGRRFTRRRRWQWLPGGGGRGWTGTPTPVRVRSRRHSQPFRARPRRGSTRPDRRARCVHGRRRAIDRRGGGERPRFLNYVSLGIYGDAVRQPAYRDAKAAASSVSSCSTHHVRARILLDGPGEPRISRWMRQPQCTPASTARRSSFTRRSSSSSGPEFCAYGSPPATPASCRRDVCRKSYRPSCAGARSAPASLHVPQPGARGSCENLL
jgi:hypothetical protein